MWRRLMVKLIVVFGVLTATYVGYVKWKYPYGWSHCCIAGMGIALASYAQEHNGRFPSGGDTPEASLSLLFSNYVDAYWLRGKTVPLKVTETALRQNGKLGPESCGWHYVEGLTEADDPQIAILWDKVGLGHNGERLKHGGHEVALVNGGHEFIPGPQWPEFLEKQKQLLAQRDEKAKRATPALIARIRLPDGQITDIAEGTYSLRTKSKSEDGPGSGNESGQSGSLRWLHLYPENGTITFELDLLDKHLRSRPVSVVVTNGRAIPDAVVFEVQPY
jgi:hypothetical protein